MNKQEAFQAMKQGNKITNRYFTSDEFLYLVSNSIMTEDNVRFTDMFWKDSYLPNVEWEIKS